MSLYNYYVPIQIWETKNIYNDLGKLFRFHIIYDENNFKIPKNLETFYPPEWDNLKNWKDIWKLKTIIFGFSPMYRGYLNRGYVMLNIYDNSTSPYNSIGLTTNNAKHFFNIKKSFMTILYPFLEIKNNFSIMFISLKATTIQDVTIFNENSSSDTEYNFLTNTVKKWNQNYYPYNNNLLLYIFTNIPSFTHWKINSENICIPSNNKNDYPTLLICNQNNQKVKNKYTFVQNNSSALSELFQDNTPFYIIFFVILVSFVLLTLFIIYKRLSAKRTLIQ